MTAAAQRPDAEKHPKVAFDAGTLHNSPYNCLALFESNDKITARQKSTSLFHEHFGKVSRFRTSRKEKPWRPSVWSLALRCNSLGNLWKFGKRNQRLFSLATTLHAQDPCSLVLRSCLSDFDVVRHEQNISGQWWCGLRLRDEIWSPRECHCGMARETQRQWKAWRKIWVIWSHTYQWLISYR